MTLPMSEAASRERASRQTWAVPGSRHDRLIRVAKVALPSGVGILLAFMALAPLDKRGDISFILDKNKVENAPERMRLESARYIGEDGRGQKFSITAQQAVQRTSSVPIVDLRGMLARLGLAQGPVTIAANQGRYNIDQQNVAVDGAVRVVGPEGYRLETRDVDVDLKKQQVVSTGPVRGEMKLGQFTAGRLRADLNERKVVLDGGARLKIVQGAGR
jgi:lipopolysaccharide export system protein LptC